MAQELDRVVVPPMQALGDPALENDRHASWGLPVIKWTELLSDALVDVTGIRSGRLHAMSQVIVQQPPKIDDDTLCFQLKLQYQPQRRQIQAPPAEVCYPATPERYWKRNKSPAFELDSSSKLALEQTSEPDCRVEPN
jgi:hypothetical protein